MKRCPKCGRCMYWEHSLFSEDDFPLAYHCRGCRYDEAAEMGPREMKAPTRDKMMEKITVYGGPRDGGRMINLAEKEWLKLRGYLWTVTNLDLETISLEHKMAAIRALCDVDPDDAAIHDVHWHNVMEVIKWLLARLEARNE